MQTGRYVPARKLAASEVAVTLRAWATCDWKSSALILRSIVYLKASKGV